MRKSLLLFLALAIFLPTVARADELTVNNGTSESTYAPLNFYNTDSRYYRSQFTYTASELSNMQGKVITSMKFYCNDQIIINKSGSKAVGNNFNNLFVKVKLGSTSSATFTSGTWKSDTTNVVLFGHVSANSTGSEITVTFNNGYYYSGGHLLVEMENVSKGSGQFAGTNAGFYGVYGTSGYRSAAADSINYPVIGTPNTNNFSPKTTFSYSNTVVADRNLFWDGNTDKRHEWISLNGNGKNVWTIGDSASTTPGGQGIYIIHDTTGTNQYITSSNATSAAFLYHFVDLKPNTEYVISYDWRCKGESNYDYMRVALASANASLTSIGMRPGYAPGWTYNSLPSGVMALDGGTQLYGIDTFQHKTVTFRTPSGTNTHYRLILFWRNDNNLGVQPPAAIDRIRITPLNVSSLHVDFETAEEHKWNYEPDGGNNYWGTGHSTYFSGEKSLFIGSGENHTYSYIGTHTSNAYVFMPIRLTAGSYFVSFNWRCNGETYSGSPCDYLRLFLAPNYVDVKAGSTPPSNVINIGGTYNLNNDWQHQHCVITVPTDTIYNLYIYWHNDGSVTNNSPAAIDNLAISKINNTLPFTPTFEGTGWKPYWVFANGGETNHWVHGNATAAYGSSIYISDDGTSYHYSTDSSSAVLAYATLDLEAGDFDVSFAWKSQGEYTHDYFRAFLVPDTVAIFPGSFSYWSNAFLPAGAIGISECLDRQSTYETLNTTVTIPSAGIWRLVFLWRNDWIYGDQPPASVDDVHLNVHQVAQYTINAVSNNEAWGTVSGGGTYDEGTTVTLTATANEGYHFERWEDSVTSATRTITVTGNATYYAIFEPNAPTQYTITVLSNNDEWGTVSGGGTYDYGATAWLIATPKPGYHFRQWNDGDPDTVHAVTVYGDSTYIAYFEENVGINEALASTVCIYPNPASDIVTIDLDGSYSDVTVSIIDLNGRTTISKSTTGNSLSLDISNLSIGTYYVKIETETGTALKKLIVE